jgi:flagellin
MSLGVLNNLSAMYAENNLNNTTNSLNTVLQQLSSGSKINSGADDAAGLSLVNGLQANNMALTQSETNASEGVGLLTVADGALSQVTNLLNRAVTLATEASNGTLNSSQDTAANQEYQSILSEVSNIGSTTTYNGNAVFGSNTNIYTGDSSTTGASVNDLNIRSLSSSNLGDSNGTMAYSSGASGGSVFVDLSSGGVNASSTDSLGLASATTSLAVNYMTTGANGTAVQASANISVGAGTSYANTTQGLMSAINGAGLGLSASFGTAAQAGTTSTSDAGAANVTGGGSTDTGIIITGSGVGSGTNGAGGLGTLTVGGSTDTLGGTLSLTGTNGVVHSITLGTANSTDTLANLASTINSAGYGVTASTNSSVIDGNAKGTVLSFTSSSSTASVTGANVTDTSGAAAAPASTVVAVPIAAVTA